MIEKLVERKNREMEAMSRGSSIAHSHGEIDRVVSDTALFAQLGSKLKMVNKEK